MGPAQSGGDTKGARRAWQSASKTGGNDRSLPTGAARPMGRDVKSHLLGRCETGVGGADESALERGLGRVAWRSIGQTAGARARKSQERRSGLLLLSGRWPTYLLRISRSWIWAGRAGK